NEGRDSGPHPAVDRRGEDRRGRGGGTLGQRDAPYVGPAYPPGSPVRRATVHRGTRPVRGRPDPHGVCTRTALRAGSRATARPVPGPARGERARTARGRRPGHHGGGGGSMTRDLDLFPEGPARSTHGGETRDDVPPD